jgi:hypothetical protein
MDEAQARAAGHTDVAAQPLVRLVWLAGERSVPMTVSQTTGFESR